MGFPGGSVGKESACNKGDCPEHRRPGFSPWVWKIPWRGNGNPIQYSCLNKVPWTEKLDGLQSMELQESD